MTLDLDALLTRYELRLEELRDELGTLASDEHPSCSLVIDEIVLIEAHRLQIRTLLVNDFLASTAAEVLDEHSA